MSLCYAQGSLQAGHPGVEVTNAAQTRSLVGSLAAVDVFLALLLYMAGGLSNKGHMKCILGIYMVCARSCTGLLVLSRLRIRPLTVVSQSIFPQILGALNVYVSLSMPLDGKSHNDYESLPVRLSVAQLSLSLVAIIFAGSSKKAKAS